MTARVSAADLTLLPMPADIRLGPGRLAVTGDLRIFVRGHDDARLRAGLGRALRRLEERTGLVPIRPCDGDFAGVENATAGGWIIECAAPGAPVPVLGEDESYLLEIDGVQAKLRAPTVLGALHGLETLLQLLQSDAGGWYLPEVRIDDQPRFPWRGLMIDVARHWQPLDVILRNLDGMALVKLNVLHLHLTDDQGFRIESKTCPRLHELGSDGRYFTQEQMREIIAAAAARGIRVVPEFDIPGHATSWLIGYPELASAPGPYAIQRGRGIFDPVLDPSNPRTYELLEKFLGEMAALFPDAYLHIGGDENNGVHWSANPRIQAYIREHQLGDNAGLHASFNARVQAMLARCGKQLVGWDEILHPSLPEGCVVHSWRGPDGVEDATKRGFACLRSHGYYIDLNLSAGEHYLNDPVPTDRGLTSEEEKRILGGEATMWSEWVTPETIDSRLWPRTAAIAERFWSLREVRDGQDMYRRLNLVSRRLEEVGLHHLSYLDPALRRLAGDGASAGDLAAWRTIVDLLEPVKHYRRNELQAETDLRAPLTGLADCARPDSAVARAFAGLVEAVVDSKASLVADAAATVAQQLTDWKAAAAGLVARAGFQSPRLQAAMPVLQALISGCDAGLEAVWMLAAESTPDPSWREERIATLERASLPHAAAELAIIAPLKRLVDAVAGPHQSSAGPQPGSTTPRRDTPFGSSS